MFTFEKQSGVRRMVLLVCIHPLLLFKILMTPYVVVLIVSPFYKWGKIYRVLMICLRCNYHSRCWGGEENGVFNDEIKAVNNGVWGGGEANLT